MEGGSRERVFFPHAPQAGGMIRTRTLKTSTYRMTRKPDLAHQPRRGIDPGFIAAVIWMAPYPVWSFQRDLPRG